MSLSERFWKKVNKSERCWEWTGCRIRQGYGRISLHRRLELAHRVSWYLHSGQWPELCVLHKCDNPCCVRPDHLFLGTHSDNMLDRERKGRRNQLPFHGERHGNAKLTDAIVMDVLRRKRCGEKQSNIARSLGLSPQQVCRLGRTSWLHIKLPG